MCSRGTSALEVEFQDGSKEVYDKFSIAASYIWGDTALPRPFTMLDVTYHPPVANPWFTQRVTPSAGVFWNYTSGRLTFYVSAG